MHILNTRYAHLDDQGLVNQVLLKDVNILAVELAKRFDHVDKCHGCPYSNQTEDGEVDRLENKVAKLESKIVGLESLLEAYDAL